MTDLPLLAASVVDVVSGAFFAFVGVLVSRKTVSREARLAARTFTVWWYALAGLTIVAGFANSGGLLGVFTALAGEAAITPTIVLGSVFAWLLLSCIALWGLLHYLIYLFRGKSLAVPLGVAYAVLFVVFALVAIQQSPQGVVASRFGVRVAYERPVTGFALVMLLLFLVLPQIGGTLAYASIYRRLEDPLMRYRVALVSTSLLAWLGLSLLAAVLRIETTDAWLVFARLLALASATAIMIAYAPPSFIRRRLGAPPSGDLA
ncbi:MAG: hypothetical protein WDA16_06410 [Candidatus Thermoplasmatota archaeon]